MPKPQEDLRTCLHKAGKDAAKVADCETKFKSDGGTVEGGKVFLTPDGDTTFRTDGGKVFSGKA
jgi:hypothetical protein